MTAPQAAQRPHQPAGSVEALTSVNVPRLALSVSEACDALGVGWDFFAEHVAPEVRIVRRGRRKLIPVGELSRWLDQNAEALLPSATGKAPPTSREVPANRGVRARRAPAREAA